jgi:acyl-coenzyme A thioesterase PaaI-like protein
MNVTEIPFNRSLGLQLAPPGSDAILILPDNPALQNHIGTVIAAAQFALAEGASGEFLLQHLGRETAGVFAALRHAEVKYRRAAHGELRARGRLETGTPAELLAALDQHGRAMPSIRIEVVDASGNLVMTGRYDWLVQRGKGPVNSGENEHNA